MTPDPIRSLDASLPPALKREQVVAVFKHCGIGGLKAYKRYRSTGTLKPLRGLPGAKQARYGKDHVLALCADALAEV